MSQMKRQFTALYKKQGKWYVGWIEEIPGVNTQGRTLQEAKLNLKEALNLVLETNKLLSGGSEDREVIRESLMVAL